MSKIIMYVLYAVLSVLAAVFPIIYIKRKFGGSLKRIRDGAAVFFNFSAILNAVIYTVIAVGFSIAEKIDSSNLNYALVNAFILTVCAGFGRFIWIKGVIREEGKTGDVLLFSAGYSSALMIVSYTISAVANAIIGVIYLVNSNPQISTVFSSNIAEIENTNLYSLFISTIQMLSIFVFEMSISAEFYKVLLSGEGKIWLLAAILTHLAGNTILRHSGLSAGTSMLIFFVITLVASGIAYSLIFEKDKKLGQ